MSYLNKNSNGRTFSIDQVGDLTGLSRATLYRYVAKGQLVSQTSWPMSFEMSDIRDFVKRKFGPMWDFMQQYEEKNNGPSVEF